MSNIHRIAAAGLVSAAAVAGVAGVPSSAFADTGAGATVIDYTRAGVETAPCVGGPAYITENNHEVMRWAPDATGAVHMTDDVTQWFTLVRVDATGTRYGETYVGKAEIHMGGVVPAGVDPQDAPPNSYVFTGRGVDPSGDVITIHQVAHIVDSPDGTPNALFDRIAC